MQAQTLRTFPASQLPQRRVMGAVLVIALHAALVAALWNMGVIQYVLPKPEEPIIVINLPPGKPPPISVPRDPTPDPVPIPTPVEPPIDYVLPPDPPPGGGSNGLGPTLNIGTGSGPVSIMRTHTRPPYPPTAIRLGEVGSVTLRMMISEAGAVTDATVLRSSGYARLDIAAVAWVKAHWLYRPATQNGQPVASNAQAEVKFELH